MEEEISVEMGADEGVLVCVMVLGIGVDVVEVAEIAAVALEVVLLLEGLALS